MLSEAGVDDMVVRSMTPYVHLGQESDFPAVDGYTSQLGFYRASGYPHNFTLGPVVDTRQNEHTQLIRDLGAAGTVLLKNTDGALLLNTPSSIGVFGNDAADFTSGQYSLVLSSAALFDSGYNIGTLAVGGGSGTGRFSHVVSPLGAIKARAESYGGIVQYITDNDQIVHGGLTALAPVPLDVCLVFLKSWASEGDDHAIADWNSTAVVERTVAACKNTIVVLHGAAPNTMPWRNNPDVTAILAGQYQGRRLATP